MDEINLNLSKKEIRERYRASILSKFGGSCVWCGKSYGPSVKATVEHIIPKSQSLDLAYYWANLAGACAECNTSKANLHWLTWYRAQSFYDPEKEKDILATLTEWGMI